MSLRSLGVRFFIRPARLFAPPSFPNATAAGFFFLVIVSIVTLRKRLRTGIMLKRLRRTIMSQQCRVALYARVSTFAAQSPEIQLCELREYAEKRGWQIVDEYVDHGV